jgi:alkylation response protein AidB-like acyl-CoA dehydrogenase
MIPGEDGMDFAFSAEQEMLRDTARRFLVDKAPSQTVRRLMETDAGFDPALWNAAADMGWQAMAIPEAYGGAGFSCLELGLLMEEMGRALFPAPFLSSIVLGADLVLTAGSEEQKQEILPAVAAGERRLALAQLEEDGQWDAAGIAMPAVRKGSDYVLSGTKAFVLDGHTADTLIVAVREPGTSGPAGVTLLAVNGAAPGISRRRVETMDMTRKQARIDFDGVLVPAAAVLGEAGAGWPALEETLRRAVVALAFEQVGGAQKCLEMSTEYAKVRIQFGRPIGSFQAVKHKCADMLVKTESAKSAAYYAGWAASSDPEELKIVAPLAKSYCSEAYFWCAAENIQVHGGIGFTWEYDAHLYFKRAKTDELLFGTPAYHRALLADAIGI